MISRRKLCPPGLTAIVELNGHRAYEALKEPVRAYPRFLPVPYTVVSFEPVLALKEDRSDLRIHAELIMVVGANVNRGSLNKVPDAVLGYSVGVGIYDASLVEVCKYPTPRDIQINKWYGHYMDCSRIQSEQIIPANKSENIRDITLAITVGKFCSKEFNLKEMIFDGYEILEEMSRIIPFAYGDIICLGPVDEPIIIPAEYHFSEDEVITVSGEPFDKFNISVLH